MVRNILSGGQFKVLGTVKKHIVSNGMQVKNVEPYRVGAEE